MLDSRASFLSHSPVQMTAEVMENSVYCHKRFCTDSRCLFCYSVGCANGHIVEGLTGKYFFCVKKSFYLQQSHIIIEMGDSLIISLVGSSLGVTIILYKTKCQPPA